MVVEFCPSTILLDDSQECSTNSFSDDYESKVVLDYTKTLPGCSYEDVLRCRLEKNFWSTRISVKHLSFALDLEKRACNGPRIDIRNEEVVPAYRFLLEFTIDGKLESPCDEGGLSIITITPCSAARVTHVIASRYYYAQKPVHCTSI